MLIRKIINRVRKEKKLVFDQLQTYAFACVTLIRRNNIQAWKKVASASPPKSWDDRNRIIAGFIPVGSSVLDVGCGAQSLRQHLRPNCKYQPADIIKSSPEVIFCDLNAGIYPQTDVKYDFVVCGGVFEYIRKPEEFLARIPKLGRTVIMSYNPLLEGGSKLARLGNGWGWVNHYKKSELEDVFTAMGLQWGVLHTDELNYIIYELKAGAESVR